MLNTEVKVTDLRDSSFKTNILLSGRSTVFQPCDKDLKFYSQSASEDMDSFKPENDDILDLSIEDWELIHFIDRDLRKLYCIYSFHKGGISNAE